MPIKQLAHINMRLRYLKESPVLMMSQGLRFCIQIYTDRKINHFICKEPGKHLSLFLLCRTAMEIFIISLMKTVQLTVAELQVERAKAGGRQELSGQLPMVWIFLKVPIINFTISFPWLPKVLVMF